MEFELWHIWLMIALIAFILEIFIPSFVLFNFGIGSLVGSLAAGLNLSLEWQIVLFSMGTLVSFVLVRPVMKKYAYKRSMEYKSNVDAIIGRIAQVSEDISNENNRGLVMLDGDVWQARSCNNQLIPKGTLVEVVQVNSIILIVKNTN
jgi:membrane protein implicated in regulation of membrane protease activity